MALTRNLRRIGMAAHNERLETQRWIEEMNRKSAERRNMICMDVSQEIRDTMTQDEYNAWWEAAPEDGFVEYAEDYLLNLKLCDRIVSDVSDEMETTLVMMSGILRGDGTLPIDDEYEMIFSGGEIIDRSPISQPEIIEANAVSNAFNFDLIQEMEF